MLQIKNFGSIAAKGLLFRKKLRSAARLRSNPAPATRKSQSVDWLFSFQAYLKRALKETGNGKRRGEAGGFSLGF